jgi:hypothetical protein
MGLDLSRRHVARCNDLCCFDDVRPVLENPSLTFTVRHRYVSQQGLDLVERQGFHVLHLLDESPDVRWCSRGDRVQLDLPVEQLARSPSPQRGYERRVGDIGEPCPRVGDDA